ncbi:alpha/beta fold hydrolase [Kordiimonas aquimaris]|uniref:alpha/beta fold hydrolase n=1 Tax=Kordiimonas aquimaris TaxID=707591 RepID=UPI0021D3665A|nr:alpha/beta fold hydrolase [Kordiimonas aquimaris]
MTKLPVRSTFRLLLSIVMGLAFAWQSAFADGGHKVFELGSFQFESGTILPNTKLSYVTHGKLNADRSNAVLVPSAYGGDHHGYDFMIGPGKALDPEKYFIIATDMFSNGLSSSPSNTPAPFDGPRFPAIAVRDNINAGYRLLREEFDIEHLYAVVGFSMGAQQALQWAVSHPDYVSRIAPYCGSAKEYPHGKVRLEGWITAITADAAYNGGDYSEPPLVGLRAGGTHWAAWGLSQEWYRQEKYRNFGFDHVEDYLREFWQNGLSQGDANDFITLARAWQTNNAGNTEGFNGDIEKALKSIKADVLYMPCATDMYFPLASLKYEAEFIPSVQFTPIPSIWGHLAGSGLNPEDNAFINEHIKAFLLQ